VHSHIWTMCPRGHLVHLLVSPRFVMVVKPSGLMRFIVAINLFGIISPRIESLSVGDFFEPGHQVSLGIK